MAKITPYDHLLEPLKSNLPAMFNSYDELNESGPSSWIVWNKDTFKAYNAMVCHAKMRCESSGFEELVTAVPNSSELSLEYLRMLIRGPFRSLSDLIKLDHIKYNYYLHCLDLKKWPANVLMNFCIASRVPIEFDYFLKPWAKYCDAGFEPTLAYLLTCSYGSKKDQTQFMDRNFSLHRPGHMWFDPASKWSNILNGIIEKPSRSYHQAPSAVTPSNIIWGKCDDYKQLMKMSDKEIAEFYTQSIKVHEVPEPPPQFIKYKKPFHLPAGAAIHAAGAGIGMQVVQQENVVQFFDLEPFAAPAPPPQPFIQHEIGEIDHDDDDQPLFDDDEDPEFDDD